MKKYTTLALLLLTACTRTELNDHDRAQINSATRAAQEASWKADKANEEAAQAKADAQRAADAAEAAAKKADSVFRSGQNK